MELFSRCRSLAPYADMLAPGGAQLDKIRHTVELPNFAWMLLASL